MGAKDSELPSHWNPWWLSKLTLTGASLASVNFYASGLFDSSFPSATPSSLCFTLLVRFPQVLKLNYVDKYNYMDLQQSRHSFGASSMKKSNLVNPLSIFFQTKPLFKIPLFSSLSTSFVSIVALIASRISTHTKHCTHVSLDSIRFQAKEVCASLDPSGYPLP